jgi:hypothetical protein
MKSGARERRLRGPALHGLAIARYPSHQDCREETWRAVVLPRVFAGPSDPRPSVGLRHRCRCVQVIVSLRRRLHR